MPTTQDVMDAFDSLGGQPVHHVALQSSLLDRGFEAGPIADAVEAAMQAGLLQLYSSGFLARP
ncbi:hypothetical protein [Burkholderia gladioli]|uniref:hypothetical protein n=1 Tax=Burkholderia gladioli TaxID=28095 RepID=UPI00163F3665|nr:hypothetical protein [Burkholderia gladioli]